MANAIKETFYLSDDGWIYTDSFGCAALEGRQGSDVGITVERGRRILTLPSEVDGRDVYIINFDWEYNDTVTDVIVPEGVGIIGPHAFWGWKKLRRIEVSDSVREVSEGALFGTSVPRRVQKKLYERTLCVTENTDEE